VWPPLSDRIALNERVFAAFYPRLVQLAENAGQRETRRGLLAQARGRTLELGAGSGLNVAHYTAAKHGVVAMSHTINMEECVNNIRSTALLPGEVATPILDKRPNPVGPEERARMVQPEDCGDLIRYIACLPARIVINEVMIAPTWNRSYVANLQHKL